MIGGFNAFIEAQKLEKIGECKVTLFQFDTCPPIPEKVYEAIDLDSVEKLTRETFVPRSGTPLYDAVAMAIKQTGERFAAMEEDERPEKVLMVVITDGEENSSHEWTSEQVKQMIEHQTDVYDWNFVYIGANQDAWEVGGGMGVASASSLGYVASGEGSTKMWDSLTKGVTKYRTRSVADAKAAKFFDDEDIDAQKDAGLKTSK